MNMTTITIETNESLGKTKFANVHDLFEYLQKNIQNTKDLHTSEDELQEDHYTTIEKTLNFWHSDEDNGIFEVSA